MEIFRSLLLLVCVSVCFTNIISDNTSDDESVIDPVDDAGNNRWR